MGTFISKLCANPPAVAKPEKPHYHVEVSTSSPTPISTLEPLMGKAKTLPVIREEEREEPEPLTAKPTIRRSSGRLGLKLMIVNRRIREGYRREHIATNH